MPHRSSFRRMAWRSSPDGCRYGWVVWAARVIEPDRRISRIRLSDKTSRLHPRHVVPKPGQAYEPEVPVRVREWISPALASRTIPQGNMSAGAS
jgi:hypothetical protein